MDEDYDEETDEFAGYSGSNAHKYNDAQAAATHALSLA